MLYARRNCGPFISGESVAEENACGTNVTPGFHFMRRAWVLYMVQLSLFWALYASESLAVTLIKSLHISLCVFNENFRSVAI
jgi:hypothetical protein